MELHYNTYHRGPLASKTIISGALFKKKNSTNLSESCITSIPVDEIITRNLDEICKLAGDDYKYIDKIFLKALFASNMQQQNFLLQK